MLERERKATALAGNLLFGEGGLLAGQIEDRARAKGSAILSLRGLPSARPLMQGNDDWKQ